MFAILAEDISDAETLERIVKRRFENDRLPVRSRGYNGHGNLFRKGSKDIKSWVAQHVKRFIICHDADSGKSSEIQQKILKEIVKKSPITRNDCCIAIPVQEIEAWLIADETAIAKVIPTFQLKSQPKPESIPNPKEWLIAESRAKNNKPLYSPKTFNPAIAKHLRFDVVSQKCPSFSEFLNCLDKWRNP